MVDKNAEQFRLKVFQCSKVLLGQRTSLRFAVYSLPFAVYGLWFDVRGPDAALAGRDADRKRLHLKFGEQVDFKFVK